jgi:hypothetical protein
MQYSLQLNDDQKIVIVYINEFVWTSDRFKDLFENKPEPHRLYLALKDADGAYYVKIDLPSQQTMKGIRFPKSKFKCPEWYADLIEVDENNVLDLDIHEDDFRNMKTWLESNFDDFKRLTHNYISTVVPDPENLPPASSTDAELGIKSAYDMLDKIQQSQEEERKDLHKLLDYMFEQDPQMTTTLGDFIDKYIRKMKADHPRLIDYPREIAMDEQFGKGANLYSMAFHLHKYSHPAQGYGSVADDLFAVIYYALLELSRRDMNAE